MRYAELMQETTVPAAMRGQVFYHGTSHDDNGRNILEHGIQPGNQGATARGHLQPVAGRSYLTPSLQYGVIYCIGGNMLGCSANSAQYLINKTNRNGTSSRYGWLFVISGETLVHDVQPDEDSVGAAASYAGRILKDATYSSDEPLYQGLLKADRNWLIRFHYNAKSSMTPKQWRDAMDGLVSAQAAGGKRFLKVMHDTDKLKLIAAGAHVAYLGPIIPDQAWRFDKMQSCDLAKDGSNFFTMAERMR